MEKLSLKIDLKTADDVKQYWLVLETCAIFHAMKTNTVRSLTCDV